MTISVTELRPTSSIFFRNSNELNDENVDETIYCMMKLLKNGAFNKASTGQPLMNSIV